MSVSRPRKVLLLEFNEINWTIIDPMIAKGKLPTFARLRAEGTTASPESVDQVPHLDPWVTWVTVHTGVDRSVHGATVLEQDVASIKARRTWQYAVEAGKSIGVFGSISAYPPYPVPGFMVPGPFAPSSQTFPPYLEPVQALNRKYTEVHSKRGKEDSPLDMVKQGMALLKLGLKPSTCAAIVEQLALERVKPYMHWKRVSLQPLINYDFFESAYKAFRPDYATWHSNHAAHYMHHYWRAMDDSKFLAPSPPEEKRKFGDAVEYGYEVCDKLLARFITLAGDDAIIAVASSMGQQPYVADLFPEGRIVVRFKDLKKLLTFLGAEGVESVVPTMVPQWNVKIPDADKRNKLKEILTNAYMVGNARPNAIFWSETGDTLTVTPGGLAKREGETRYFFPGVPSAKPEGHLLDEFFECDTPTPKQGMHHPTGIFMLYGKGITPGLHIANTSNLDIAPTLLSLLGVPVPAIMKGRVLGEAWGEAPSAREERASAQA
ncbi:MAG: hypothetical protein U0359_16205 [Byssovorax sp.]